jgi:hypothetical protein
VKTLSDVDRGEVDLGPVTATVAELAALPRPPFIPNDRRARPVETTVYRVEAYLVGWSPQADGDIHLNLADLTPPHAMLIAEIPNPVCAGACNSGLSDYFRAARAELDAILSAANPNDEPIVVSVTGVGFFDRNHGQTGAAPNYIELHPVLHLVRLRP